MNARTDLARLTDPVDVLIAVTDLYGGRIAVASSLGPQTLVVIDLLHRLGRPVPVHFLDTGLMFPETHALREKLRARYGLDVRSVHPARTVEEQARDEGPALWLRDPDRCCALRKVDPLRGLLRGLDAWITGVRRSHGGGRAEAATVQWDDAHGLVKVNPLAHWSRDQVFAYLREHDVPYNELLDRGYRSVGCAPCTRPVAPGDDPDDERAGRWAWTGKTECGMHYGEVEGGT
jgi:phosphoadenosine phosphosulfate reductase